MSSDDHVPSIFYKSQNSIEKINGVFETQAVPNIDPTDLPEGMEDDLNVLKKELFGSKIAEQNILAQSVAAGGPSSAQGAIQNLMDYGKIGIRRLSAEVAVPRKKLQAMVEGRIDMPGEISNKIITFFEQKLPHLFQ